MPKLVLHGGQCCGLRHVYGFADPNARMQWKRHPVTGVCERDKHGMLIGEGPTSLEIFHSEIDKLFRETGSRAGYSKTIEVVLTNSQIATYPAWLQAVQDKGFKLVNRFRNTTGAVCNVFHLSPSHVDEPLKGWIYK